MTTGTLNTLIVGATGTTGQHLVGHLLERGHRVSIVARTPTKLPESVRDHENATVIVGSVLDMTDNELAQHVQGCDAIASCLGHNLSVRGMIGPPWRLVAGSASRLCKAVHANSPDQPVRFVLMNSTGCRNRAVPERVSLAQRLVVRVIRTLVPPHADNEAAAAFFQRTIGTNNPEIEWAIVRPDSLMNEDAATPDSIHASPVRSAIFNPGKTSRINVANFMTELMTDSETWSRWVGQMPVIYNKDSLETEDSVSGTKAS